MTNTTHTPGPWRVDIFRYNAPGREAVPTIVTPADAIAEACPLWCPDDREAERLANARLIAAAPDLLAACQAALSQLTEEREEYLQADIDQLRAAIATATTAPQ